MNSKIAEKSHLTPNSRRNFLLKLSSSAAGLAVLSNFGCAKGDSSRSIAGTSAPEATLATASESESLRYCVVLPKNEYESRSESGKVIITTNSVPNHRTGIFPNLDCPCAIRAIEKTYSISGNPQEATSSQLLNGWLFGIAVNGVAFDPTGPFWDADSNHNWEFDVMSSLARPFLGLDCSSAHVQPNGEYHYHGLPHTLLSGLMMKNAGRTMVLLGVAADGFPIYGPFGYASARDPESGIRELRSSYRLKRGTRSGGPSGQFDGAFLQDYEYVENLGDFDEWNGRYGVTPEFPNGTYYYVITSAFPYIPRGWRGTPDDSFAHGLPGPAALPPALRKYAR